MATSRKPKTPAHVVDCTQELIDAEQAAADQAAAEAAEMAAAELKDTHGRALMHTLELLEGGGVNPEHVLGLGSKYLVYPADYREDWVDPEDHKAAVSAAYRSAPDGQKLFEVDEDGNPKGFTEVDLFTEKVVSNDYRKDWIHPDTHQQKVNEARADNDGKTRTEAEYQAALSQVPDGYVHESRVPQPQPQPATQPPLGGGRRRRGGIGSGNFD